MAYDTIYVCDLFLSIYYYQIVNFSLSQTLLNFNVYINVHEIKKNVYEIKKF